MYKEGQESEKDEPCASRPSTSRTGEKKRRVRHLLNLDRRLNVCIIAEKLRMDKMVVRKVIIKGTWNEEHLCQACLQNLDGAEKVYFLAVSKYLLERFDEYLQFFNNVITKN